MMHELLNHPDFKAMVEKMRADMTRQVMARQTSPEDREEILRRYHLLDSILAEMGASTQE